MLAVGKGCLLDVNGPMLPGAWGEAAVRRRCWSWKWGAVVGIAVVEVAPGGYQGGGGSGNGVGPPVEFVGTTRGEWAWIEYLMLAAGKGCLLDVNGPMLPGAGMRWLSGGGGGFGNGVGPPVEFAGTMGEE